MDILFPHQWMGDIDQIGFNEPSGICWHSGRGTLFVVGDEGDLCEIRTDGTPIKQQRLRAADLEGVTHDPATGLLYIAVEGEETILEVDPETFTVRREFSLPRRWRGQTRLRERKEGIEAITFVPNAAHAEGGTFYVANQAFTLTDEEDVSAIFEVELPLRSETGEPTIIRSLSPGIIDLAGLFYDAESNHLFVVSDATNVLLEVSMDLEVLKAYAFPGDNQEGITADPDGFLYIAQDSGGILKVKWLREP